MNIVVLSGRLTKDPVKCVTQSNISVCNFSLAVQRPHTKKEDNLTDYFDCVIWRQGADILEKYYHKGDGITVSGYLQTKQWTDKDGNQRSGIEIMVNDFEHPLTRKNQGEAQGTEATAPDGYVQVKDDEPLPF